MTSLGSGVSGSPVTSFTYDASDRNTSISQTSSQGTVSTSYVRDVNGPIIARTTTDTTGHSVTTKHSSGVAMDASFTIIEKDIGLSGDVSLTLRPQSTSASYLTASMTNLHGDTIATVDADGVFSMS